MALKREIERLEDARFATIRLQTMSGTGLLTQLIAQALKPSQRRMYAKLYEEMQSQHKNDLRN